MDFPRPVVEVNGCIAVAYSSPRHKKKAGQPVIKNDYPFVVYQDERWSGHRLSYALNREPIQKRSSSGKENLILHHCDHKWCINPEHLYLGTQKDNARDMFSRHPTVRQKLSDAAKIRKPSAETRRKMSESHLGNRNSLGYKHTAETRTKMSKAHSGHKHTTEARRHMSEAQKGNKNSLGHKHAEEVRRKISKTLTGRKISAEARKKMSEAAKARWRREKARQSPEYRA